LLPRCAWVTVGVRSEIVPLVDDGVQRHGGRLAARAARGEHDAGRVRVGALGCVRQPTKRTLPAGARCEPVCAAVVTSRKR